MENTIWRQAQQELEGALTMFNYAETQAHTDISIEAINLAEEQLKLIKDYSDKKKEMYKKLEKISPTKGEDDDEEPKTLLQMLKDVCTDVCKTPFGGGHYE